MNQYLIVRRKNSGHTIYTSTTHPWIAPCVFALLAQVGLRRKSSSGSMTTYQYYGHAMWTEAPWATLRKCKKCCKGSTSSTFEPFPKPLINKIVRPLFNITDHRSIPHPRHLRYQVPIPIWGISDSSRVRCLGNGPQWLQPTRSEEICCHWWAPLQCQIFPIKESIHRDLEFKMVLW